MPSAFDRLAVRGVARRAGAWRRSARVWTAAATLALGLVSAPAHADVDDGISTAEDAATAFPLSGEVELESSFAAGTFVADEEQRRTSIDLSLALTAAYKFRPGLTLTAKEIVVKKLQASADDDVAHLYYTQYFDPTLALGWTPQTRGDDGKSTAWKLPGGITPKFGLSLGLPVSRASRYQTKLFSLLPSVGLSRTELLGGLLSLSYSFGYQQNFHRFTAPTRQLEDGTGFFRPGEDLGGGEFATGTATNIQFVIRNSVAAEFDFSDHWSASASYVLFNSFGYDSVPLDDLSSPHASAGRGRSDTQWGTLAVTYGFGTDGDTSVTAQAFTASPPKTADNQSFRFPFFDFRSTSDNYTSVSLVLSRAF